MLSCQKIVSVKCNTTIPGEPRVYPFFFPLYLQAHRASLVLFLYPLPLKSAEIMFKFKIEKLSLTEFVKQFPNKERAWPSFNIKSKGKGKHELKDLQRSIIMIAQLSKEKGALIVL